MRPGGFRILLTAEATGGIWQYSLDLAGGLSRLGIETVLAVMGPPPSEAQREAAAAVPKLQLIDTGLARDALADDDAALAKAAETIARLAHAAGVDLVQLDSAALAASADFDL